MTLVTLLLAAALLAPSQSTERIEARGAYRNDPSGFSFPEAVGPFRRTGIERFSAREDNVGVSYRSGPSPVALLTVYVYPVPLVDGEPMPLVQQFAIERRGIHQYTPDAIDVRTRQGAVEQEGRSVPGYMGELVLPQFAAGERVKLSSRLYLFQHEGWTVKYRATYPEGSEEAAAAVDRFASTFSWAGARPRDATAPFECKVTVFAGAVDLANPPALAAWLAYGGARLDWRKKNTYLPLVDGPEPPVHTEEVQARKTLVTAWRELAAEASDPYLDELKGIAEAGFLEEYVHAFVVADPAWAGAHAESLASFAEWREQHLEGHVPVTAIGIDCE